MQTLHEFQHIYFEILETICLNTKFSFDVRANVIVIPHFPVKFKKKKKQLGSSLFTVSNF